jgi:hypothetical protein
LIPVNRFVMRDGIPQRDMDLQNLRIATSRSST